MIDGWVSELVGKMEEEKGKMGGNVWRWKVLGVEGQVCVIRRASD